MATVSCYMAQVAMVAMLLGFAVFASIENWPFTAWAFAIAGIVATFGGSCTYLAGCI